jgi:hypothetical protein
MKQFLRRVEEFDAGSTAFYRLMALVVGLVANLAAIAVLARGYGAGEYAAYALLASLINLLPFADLGLGASLVNSTSDYNGGRLARSTYERHVSRVRDLLLVVAFAVAVTDFALFFSGGWTRILGSIGDAPGVAEGATFTILCVAAALPLGLGARVLQGRSRMSLVVRIGVVGPALQLAIVLGGFAADAPVLWYFIAPGLGYLAIAAVSTFAALRGTDFRLIAVGRGLTARSAGDVRIAGTAIPFVVISVGMAAGFQSHRILLANFGSAAEVASYSIVAQFAGPMMAVIAVIGQNLWNRYRSELAGGALTVSTFRSHIAIFAVVGVLAALAIPAVVPFAAVILTGGAVQPGLAVCFAAAAYIAVNAIHQPGAMLLTDSSGLWMQAGMVCLVAIGSVLFFFAAISSFGAASPYLASAVAMILFQVPATIAIAIRRIRLAPPRPPMAGPRD